MLEKAQILLVNGSPRSKNNTEILLKKAADGVNSISNTTIKIYNFQEKIFKGCKGTCISYCMKKGECCIDDDFNDFMGKWLEADGIIFGVPVYHMAPPSQVKAVLERLGNVLFVYLKGGFPRFNKVCGALVQGSSRWGGQEITLQFFILHFLVMNCIPVSGDMPQSYLGVAGYAPTWESDSILEDEVALNSAENLGCRIGEMVKIIKAGINTNKSELPDIYFYKKVLEKRRSLNNSNDMRWQKNK